MQFLEWLQSWPISDWIAGSDWGYPILLSVHSIGLAAVVGIVVMLDLRVLGLGKSVPISAFSALLKYAWYGFTLNAISGVLLFLPGGIRLATCWPFLLKMASIAAGGVIGYMLVKELKLPSAAQATAGGPKILESEITPRSRVIAVASLGFWLVALIAGRLIAYVIDAAILAGN